MEAVRCKAGWRCMSECSLLKLHIGMEIAEICCSRFDLLALDRAAPNGRQ